MHINDLIVRQWLQQRMEATQNGLKLSRDSRIRILTRLTQAVVFEEFVQKKYLGAKTFSLEGAETLIPLLELAIEKAAHQGIVEIVMAMAHRGRLNVLANTLAKPPEQIFREFEDRDRQQHEKGDVKYHLGHSHDWITADGHKVHLSLAFNPSHLEFVNPVVAGRTRAKQDRGADFLHEQGMALLIHGDAAFAGEGIVQETLNQSQLPAYTTGGTLHLIVNNQIGFTTLPEEGRTSTYAASIFKMLEVPVFHVNGEHPEAVAQVVDLAMDFRKEFRRDAVIDMYCYRRRGHSESDEPSFTQPLLYRELEKRPSVRESYLGHMSEVDEGVRNTADRIAEEHRRQLEEAFDRAQQVDAPPPPYTLQGVWKSYCGGHEPVDGDVDTGVDRQLLVELLEKLTKLPDDFQLHPKLDRWLEKRHAMARGQQPLDWASAEALAFATLAVEGYRVRLSGQDTARGTFSHRHAVLHDVENGQTYVPLQHMASDQAPVDIINSPLSEAGALGFEYGYSLDYPDALVAWEAQFGDFWNAAQVIVDQFLASAEEKWRRLSGITLLLPHGFEGQGPEHSSARLERFLLLGTEDNIQVAVPSTPAQYFHLLRRQMLRRWLKPLVILTPKSLLRHPGVVSELDECAIGRFQRVIPDVDAEDADTISRILLCSGKIYYELLEKREELQRKDVAIVRLEQLYPFPDEPLRLALATYPDGIPAVWVQEEPENMGARHFLEHRLHDRLFDRFPFRGVSRPASASPATGSATVHRREQEELASCAFGPLQDDGTNCGEGLNRSQMSRTNETQ
jgi:2-oxoglutarate dehydrogenase E1 component